MKYRWKLTGVGAIDNLGLQLEKVASHMNESQLSTRRRYLQANGRFVKFLAEEYKLERLANLGNKHLEGYARRLIDEGKSHKYIKNELSGIRFIHNHMENTKSRLIDGTKFNNSLKLDQTKDGRADRAWSDKELRNFCAYAKDINRLDMVKIFKVTRAVGTRVDEICTLRRRDLDNALETKKLHLTNTKGGVPRDITINSVAVALFKEHIKNLKSTDYVYTPMSYVHSHTIHKYENKVQKFIYNHRDKIQDSDRNASAHNVKDDERGALTLHGLRHAYARGRYKEFLDLGFTKQEARKKVAKELGHGRDKVTLIYLSGKG